MKKSLVGYVIAAAFVAAVVAIVFRVPKVREIVVGA